jgi:hypothetical protein
LEAVTQHEFVPGLGTPFPNLVVGSQQECEDELHIPKTQTSPGVATERNAIATRLAARMCRTRIIYLSNCRPYNKAVAELTSRHHTVS